MRKIMLTLYPHNKSAYEKANGLMERVGRAAVIHPTGTGKSLIAFQVALAHPDKRILWLSPSEYIYRTQCENLEKLGVEKQDLYNIHFMTYLQLLYQINEIATLHPDYIILDEFHRCGAPEWGKGVSELIETYPHAKLLGISATNIRYLDNQRDMAQEIFDGIIASEMTLGEAIADGILPSATYVISMYNYKKEIEKLEERIWNGRNKQIQCENEKLLEKLKRTLEKADGIDQIFRKHITKKSSKFIIFCTDRLHMLEMKAHISEWFGQIDEKPHVYTVFHDDAYSSEEFRLFKRDKSRHLKLLLCINMLNEGIHVADIDGVILMRPTSSPAIFLQQIGRALSAGDTRHPIIFDLVNNFESLDCIDALKNEIEIAFGLQHGTGKGSKYDGDFQIVDEVKECRQLFERIRKNLRSGWDIYYREAKKYYMAHGDLRAGKSYEVNGLQLGKWIILQRRIYQGKTSYQLTESQIVMLEAIGMEWEPVHEREWMENYQKLVAYKETYGDTIICAEYVKENGSSLKCWVKGQREKWNKGKRESLLSEKQKKEGMPKDYITTTQERLLEEIGMIWDVKAYRWNRNYEALKAFKEEYGHTDVPKDYYTKEGINLHSWLSNQRLKYRANKTITSALEQERFALLDDLGIIWSYKDEYWERGYREAKKYYHKHKKLDCTYSYVSPSGYKLGAWIIEMRDKGRKNLLSEEQRAQLYDIGMIWDKSDHKWMFMYEELKKYYAEHGNTDMHVTYRTEEGILLGAWLDKQKKMCSGVWNKGRCTITKEQMALLEEMDIDLSGKGNHHEDAWEKGFSEFLTYVSENGNANAGGDYITKSGYHLGNWIQNQRTKHNRGELSVERTKRLSQNGFIWDKAEYEWMRRYELVKQYKAEHGNLKIPRTYKSSDGAAIGEWLMGEKMRFKNAEETAPVKANHKKLLMELGVVFESPEIIRWNYVLAILKEYYEKHGIIDIPRKYVLEDGYDIGNYLTAIRNKKKKGTLSQEKIDVLDQLHFVWDLSEYRWQKSYEMLALYKEKYGHTDVPVNYKTEEGYMLGNWVNIQRKNMKKENGMSAKRRELLEQIGIIA